MKPMLAVAMDPAKTPYPLYASVKLDGVRCIIKDGIALSRKLIPIPNLHVQKILGHAALNGLDGELTVGPANAQDLMQRTMSAVMSTDGTPEFTFWVFDFWTAPDMPWAERNAIMVRAEKDGTFADQTYVMLLKQTIVADEAEMLAFDSNALTQGYEGTMVRRPRGIYKYGRSTAKEGHLLKRKPWADSEAVVIGFVEQMHNGNEATTDNVGNSKRSTNSENMVPANTLGSFLVRDAEGKEFGVSPGILTHPERKYIWDHRTEFASRTLTFKHFKQCGVKDKPRFNIFKSFRDLRDMS